ncbi:hypothetical protein ACPWSR_15610 [Alloiococcus sp. CFN-8]|uniref:hypothetical protein n=1 Tax=Alloiococcus sp. CFN-8 TaxID=3416081 RepID=UPI003CF9ECCF
MLDQAETLRQLANLTNKDMHSKIITIVSRNVGEEDGNFALKLAEAIAIKGEKVLIIIEKSEEALNKEQPFIDMLNYNSSMTNLKNSIINSPLGVKILQGFSKNNKNSYEYRKIQGIKEQLHNIGDFNYILIYTGADTDDTALSYITLSDMVYVITNTQINSITETYSLIKAINHHKLMDKVKLIVYKPNNIQEGYYTYNNINSVVKRFLDIEIEYSGVILRNSALDIQRIAGEVLSKKF